MRSHEKSAAWAGVGRWNSWSMAVTGGSAWSLVRGHTVRVLGRSAGQMAARNESETATQIWHARGCVCDTTDGSRVGRTGPGALMAGAVAGFFGF